MKKFFITALLLSTFSFSFFPTLAIAQSGVGTFPAPSGGGVPPPSGVGGGNSVFGITNPLGSTSSFCQLIKVLLNVIILLGVPIATFFLVYAGFKLVIARGNSGALQKARQNLMWVIIGIAVFLGAWLLAGVISSTISALGITILGSCT